MVPPFHGRGDLIGGHWRSKALLFYERWHWTETDVESLLLSSFDFYYDSLLEIIKREQEMIKKG